MRFLGAVVLAQLSRSGYTVGAGGVPVFKASFSGRVHEAAKFARPRLCVGTTQSDWMSISEAARRSVSHCLYSHVKIYSHAESLILSFLMLIL